jgi:ketosteroid isomerase-like protein
MRIASVLSIILGAFSVPALADDADLKKQMDQISVVYSESFNKKDAAGLLASWAPDGIWVNAIAGPSKLVPETYENMFKAGLEHLEASTTQVVPLGPDTAIGTGTYHFKGKNPTNGAAIDTEGFWSAAYVKDGGKWKLKMLMGAPKPPPVK